MKIDIAGTALFLLIMFMVAGIAQAGSAKEPEYQTQKAVVVAGESFAPVDLGIIKATPAPEIKVPSEVERPKTSGEEQYDWLIEQYGPPVYDGWICGGPGYICRGEEASKEQEESQQDWLDDQAREEVEAEANAPWTCEGSGSYGDYSPEGYEGCPGR